MRLISQLPDIFPGGVRSLERVTECHQSDGFRRLENCLFSSQAVCDGVFRKGFARFRHLHSTCCLLSGRSNLNDFVRMRKMRVELPN